MLVRAGRDSGVGQRSNKPGPVEVVPEKTMRREDSRASGDCKHQTEAGRKTHSAEGEGEQAREGRGQEGEPMR